MTPVALALVLAAGAGVAAWRWPVTGLIALSRARLSVAGLRRQVHHGRFGRQVWWSGGSGPTLVLLHGMNDQAGSWSHVVGHLAQRWHVMVPDLAGHGASGPQAGRLGLDTIRDALDDLLLAASPPGQWILVGNSMGAWMAQLIAQRHPSRVRRIVLECGGGLSFGDLTIDLLPESRDEARAFAVRVMGRQGARVPAFVLDHVVRRLRHCPLGRVLETDWRALHLDHVLSDPRVPVDLVWGEADGVLPLAYAKRLAASVPGARLHVLPGAAHIPHRDRAHAFLATLDEVLEAPLTESRQGGSGPGALEGGLTKTPAIHGGPFDAAR